MKVVVEPPKPSIVAAGQDQAFTTPDKRRDYISHPSWEIQVGSSLERNRIYDTCQRATRGQGDGHRRALLHTIHVLNGVCVRAHVPRLLICGMMV
jgi:hypothetical protein